MMLKEFGTASESVTGKGGKGAGKGGANAKDPSSSTEDDDDDEVNSQLADWQEGDYQMKSTNKKAMPRKYVQWMVLWWSQL